MKKNTQIMKMADAVKFLGLPGSKGYSTPEYLGMIIDRVEQMDYRFIQFLQLVDILYVIFDRRVQVKQAQAQAQGRVQRFNPEAEIEDHYKNRDREDVRSFMNKKKPGRNLDQQADKIVEIERPPKSDIISDKEVGSTFGNPKMPWDLNN